MKSEFQKILELKLNIKPGVKESPQPLSSINDFQFGADFFKMKIFNSARKYDLPGKQQIILEAKPLKVERPIEVAIEKPQSRVKRKLTFDQNRAAKYFSKLGEPTDEYSSVEEIKSAYRRLAKKFHPDAGMTSNAETFKQLALAYKLLIK